MTGKDRLTPVDAQGFLIQSIETDDQKGIARTYALAMRDHWHVDWKQANEAVIASRGPAALTAIKTRAWKIVEGKVAFDD